jgi:methionine--tRNA ligase beta chain
MGTKSALELVENLIIDLEAKLNLAPGADPAATTGKKQQQQGKQIQKKKEKKQVAKESAGKTKGVAAALEDPNLPDICKLEFKVGLIVKAWVHPDADKLYCEEIDCGEEGGPRQIASGLRAHYNLEEIQGKRVLVVANLKAKSLVGFKSNGMVLCAAETNADGTEKVEFVEPPEGAPLGEVVTFEGLSPPAPLSASQVEKKKLFAACMDGMRTNDKCEGTWNGYVFMTSAGSCKSVSIKGGVMR